MTNLISRYFDMIMQTIQFPVMITMTKTESTAAHASATVSETDRMAMSEQVDDPPNTKQSKGKCNRLVMFSF